MKKIDVLLTAARIAAIWLALAALMIVDRGVFIAVYGGSTGASPAELWGVALWQGVAMDLSTAGYLAVLPGMMAVAGLFTGARWLRLAEKGYFMAVAAVLSVIFCLDIVLYGYWGFRLDMTPIFYFTTSPAAAMASAEWWQVVAGAVITAVWGVAMYAFMRLVGRCIPQPAASRRVAAAVIGVMALGALFIPIRGGLSVSTMNLSRAYYSSNIRLNHIAVNPVFSLLYSAGHQSGFDRQFRFFADDAEARGKLPREPEAAIDDAPVELTLTTSRPDIYLIILESFSAHLMPTLGGAPVAVRLDSIARSGVLFTRFYANSFRTDRAIPALLSGFPSQPTASVMKYADKVERLPGIAAELHRQAGYETTYYYGGDINFTNQLAYLRSTGFDRIVSDRDFAPAERKGKWGAHDHVLLARVLAELPAAGAQPQFVTIQTSSSHEPFKVPFRSARWGAVAQANAFAYTDSCVAQFVNAVSRASRPSLIVLVPDHYGAWPPRDSLPDFASRHHIPLIFTGTALATRPATIAVTASQNDLAATLLGMLSLDSSAFAMSRDILDPSVAHFAWISEPDLAGIIRGESMGGIDITSGQTLPGTDAALADGARAWLQLIYSSLGK